MLQPESLMKPDYAVESRGLSWPSNLTTPILDSPSNGARTGTMQAELQVLEAQYKGLQALVGELLLTNQKLRAEVAELRRKAELNAKATPPPPHPDR